MGFRIHRGIFQKLNSDRTAYENAFKMDTDGQLKPVDRDGTVTGAYLTSVPSEFLTQTEGDGRYLQISGGTITGNMNFNGYLFLQNEASHDSLKKSNSFVNPRDPWNNFHLKDAHGQMYFDSGAYHFRSSGSTEWGYWNADGLRLKSGWLRVDGSQGIYFQSYGGGWRMTDSSWIRAYNDKNIYTGGNIEVGGTIRSNGNGFYVDSTNVINSSGRYIADVDNSTTTSRYFIQSAHGNPRNNLGSPTVTEMALFDSQFRCMTDLSNNYTDLDRVTFWVQQNEGDAWAEVTVSDDQKKRFLRTNSSNVAIPNRAYKFRVEFKAPGYVFANALYFYWSSNSHSTKVHVYKYNASQDTWHAHATSNTNVSSWPGHLYLPFSTIPWHETHTTSTGHHRYIRVEFIPNWSTGSYADRTINLNGGQVWGGYPSGRRTPHSIDHNGNYFFPARLYTDGGSGDGSILTDRDWVNSNTLNQTEGDARYLRSVPNHSASLITSGTLDGARLPWNDNDGFSGTYPIVWRATNDLYTSSWLQVRGSDDTLLTRSIDADGNVIANNFYVANAIYHEGDTNTYVQFEGDRIRIAAGGTVKFDSNSTYVTTGGSQTISGAKTFTSNSLTLKGHLYFNEHSAGRHYIHFKAAGSTNQVDWRIQTNSSNTIIHSWSERNALFRTNLETTGTVTATGGNSTEWNTAYDWGNHASAGYLTSVPSEYLTQTEGDARYLQSLPSHNHIGVHPYINSSTSGSRGPDFDALLPSANQTTYKEVHAINEGTNFPSGAYTYGVVHSQYMTSMKFQWYVPHTASRGDNNIQDTIYFRTNWGGGNWYGWKYLIHSGNIAAQSVNYANSAGAVAWGNVTSKPSTFTPSAHTHNFITNTTSYVSGSAMQSWDRQESTPDLNPTTDWFTSLRIGHGHPVDYYSNTLAIQMTGGDSGRIYTRTITNGSKGTWKKYWHGGDFTSTNISNWNTAYNWGNHASAGYVTSVTDALGYTPYQEGTALSATTISATNKISLNGGHSSARVVIKYNHNGDDTSENSGNLVMWTSEPGISYASGGIGSNIHESGHYYGKRNTNIPYGVALRFNVSSGRAEFQTTASTDNGSFRVGWYMDSNGNTVQQGTITASGYNKSNWDTAYGWGNHSSAGYLTSVPNLAASKITSGTFANARISQSSVTQHQSALSIAASQVSGLPAATPPVQAFVEGGEASTLSSITFDPGTGNATFTLADGQTFRLAFAR